MAMETTLVVEERPDRAGSGTDALLLPDEDLVKSELALTEPQQIQAVSGEDAALEDQAKEVTERLFNLDEKDTEALRANKAAVETMGLHVQRESAHRSDMLKNPVKVMSERGAEGGDVAKALIDLKLQVEELDPPDLNLSPGWFSRFLGYLPFIGNPVKRYFTKYESAQTVLSAIKESLLKGQKQLQRDNITLADDQDALRELNVKLEKAIKLGQLVDQRLQAKIERELVGNEARRRFIEEEILFPLRQRIQDLQQSMVVNQQGIVSMELIIRTNKELVRGVDRALNVTMSALTVAVTVAMAVAHQKIVLDKVLGVQRVTEDLIAGTAKRLREQVAATNKAASEAQLDMATLRQSFADIRAALDDISTFRQNALPRMAQTILELDRMTSEQDAVIEKLEDGNKLAGVLHIDPD